jgi:hypothetical protein
VSDRLIERFASGYGVELIDYARPSRGLLIAVGSGLAMAVMDGAPSLRWSCEAGGPSGRRLQNFLVAANRHCEPIAVAAWWSISQPAALVEALRGVDAGKLLVYSNLDLGRGQRVATLAELLRQLDLYPAIARESRERDWESLPAVP